MNKIQLLRSLAFPILAVLAGSTTLQAQSPGGVANPTAWFKADNGVTVVGGFATSWSNTAINPQLLLVTGTAGTNILVSNTPAPFNFNPYINLNNGSFSAGLLGLNDVLNASEGSLFGVGVTPDQIVEVTETTPVSPCGAIRCNSGPRGATAEFGGVGVGFGGATNANVANLFGLSASNLSTPNSTVSRNGFLTNGASGTRSPGNYQFAIGRFFGTNYQGGISEVLAYNRKLTNNEYSRVEGYLALKFGITLGNNTNPRDYLSSTGAVLWPASSIYQNNVTAIGQDNGSGLIQKQAQSVNTTGILSLYNGNTVGVFPAMNANNTSTFPANNSWLVVGDNGLSATTYGRCSSSGNVTFSRISKTWLAKQTGTNGPQTLAVLKTSLPANIRYLAVSADTAFTPAVTTLYPLLNGGTRWYASLTLANNQFFTFVSDTLRIDSVGSNSPLCQSTTLLLTATTIPGATYTWTGPNGFTSTSQNPAIGNIQPNQAGNYTVVATLNNCSSVPAITNVVVKLTPPAPTAGNNGPICSGKTLNLTSTTVTGATYGWTGPSGFNSSVQNPTIPNATTGANGTYMVIATVNGCPSASASTVAIVNQTPVAPTVTSRSYCQYDSATPLTAVGNNLQWYTASAGGTGTGVAPTPNTAIAGTITWYVSQTSALGCESPRAALVIVIKPRPVPPFLPTPVISYCQYEPANSLVANGTMIRWYSTDTGRTSSNSVTPVTTAAGTFTFYVSQTVNGCESERAMISVIVKPKPAPPTVSSPVNLCQNSGPYTATAIGSNLKWYTVQAGGLGDPTAPVVPTGSVDTLTFYVSQTVDGCESDRSLLNIKVSEKPVGFIDISRQFACAEDTITLNFSGVRRPYFKYFWTVPVEFGTIERGDSTGGPLVVRLKKGGRFTVKLQVDNNGCAADLISDFVRVRDLPIIAPSVPEEGCVGEEVVIQLGSTDKTLDSLQWNFGSGALSSPDRNFGPFYIRYQTPGIKVISVRGRSTEGCFSHYAYDTVIIHEKPVALITGVTANEVCLGDTVTLTAQYDPRWTYTWLPKRFTDTLANETNVVRVPVLRNGTVTLIVNSDYTCSDTTTIDIKTKPCCDMVFPDAFTPNGDGKNDVFRPITNGYLPTFKDYRVFNRWGQVVFTGASSKSAWDGTYRGEAQPMETYFYIVNYKCEDGKQYQKQGEVILIR